MARAAIFVRRAILEIRRLGLCKDVCPRQLPLNQGRQDHDREQDDGVEDGLTRIYIIVMVVEWRLRVISSTKAPVNSQSMRTARIVGRFGDTIDVKIHVLCAAVQI